MYEFLLLGFGAFVGMGFSVFAPDQILLIGIGIIIGLLIGMIIIELG